MQRLFYNRREADHLRKLEIFWLRKRGLLKGYCTQTTITWGEDNSIGIEINLFENLREYLLGKEMPKDGFIRLLYKNESQRYDYRVPLTTTDCNYGNYRYWFTCPLCSRRVGVLYCRSSYYACRHCNYLTYESKNVSGRQKAFGRIISIPELESIKNEVKRPYYNGNMTRKYKRYLRIEKKARTAYRMNLLGSILRGNT